MNDPRWWHDAHATDSRHWNAIHNPVTAASEQERAARAAMVAPLIETGHLVTGNRDWTAADCDRGDALLVALKASLDAARAAVERREGMQ